MMQHLTGTFRYPAIRFIIFFCLGITAQYIFRINIIDLFAGLVLLMVLLGVLLLRKALKGIRIVSILLVFFFGAATLAVRTDTPIEYPVDDNEAPEVQFQGTVTSVELQGTRDFRFTVQADTILTASDTVVLSSTFICTVYDYSRTYREFDRLFRALSPGNRVTVSGILRKPPAVQNPGEFDYRAYLANMGINGLVTIGKAAEVQIVDSSRTFFIASMSDLKKYFSEKLTELHTPQAAALVRGLLLGDRRILDDSVKADFVDAGVFHVLSVSGLHTAFIALFFFLLLQRFHWYFRIGLTIAGLVIFFFITDGSAPVFRAVIMSIVFLIVPILNRSSRSINLLAVAACIILLIRPTDLFTASFQLSFSAILAILIFYPILRKACKADKVKNSLLRGALELTMVTIAAQIGTLPFTAIYFGKISIAALFANHIVIPATGLILGASIVTIITSAAAPGWALLPAYGNELMISLLLSFIHYAGSLDWAFFEAASFSVLDGIVFAVVLVCFLFGMYRFTNLRAKVVLSCLLALLLFLGMKMDDASFFPEGSAGIGFIATGRYDAVVLHDPSGSAVLLRAGDLFRKFDSTEEKVIPFLKRRELSLVIYFPFQFTDVEKEGLTSLVRKNYLEKAVLPARADTASIQALLSEEAPDEEFSIETADTCSFGQSKLYGLPVPGSKKRIIKFVSGYSSALFFPDLSVSEMRAVIYAYGMFLKAGMLYISDAGNNESCPEELLAAVQPAVIVLDAKPKRKKSFPAEEVMNRCKNFGAEVYSTKYNGGVYFYADPSINSGEERKFYEIEWR